MNRLVSGIKDIFQEKEQSDQPVKHISIFLSFKFPFIKLKNNMTVMSALFIC